MANGDPAINYITECATVGGGKTRAGRKEKMKNALENFYQRRRNYLDAARNTRHCVGGGTDVTSLKRTPRSFENSQQCRRNETTIKLYKTILAAEIQRIKSHLGYFFRALNTARWTGGRSPVFGCNFGMLFSSNSGPNFERVLSFKLLAGFSNEEWGLEGVPNGGSRAGILCDPFSTSLNTWTWNAPGSKVFRAIMFPYPFASLPPRHAFVQVLFPVRIIWLYFNSNLLPEIIIPRLGPFRKFIFLSLPPPRMPASTVIRER